MKIVKILVITLFYTASSRAQMGINASGAAPDTKAILDITSTTKGLLIPRMNTNQRNSLATTEGLTVYDTDTHSYWYFKAPGVWTEVANGGTSPWATSGSNIVNSNTGNVGIGTAIPNKAGLIVNTKVGNTHAIFGENTSGVSIESAWPGIHFNSYFNGTRKSLAGGFGGGFEMETATGNLNIYTTPTSVGVGATLTSQNALVINKLGNIGLGVAPSNLEKLNVLGNSKFEGYNYNYQTNNSHITIIQRAASVTTNNTPILKLINGFISVDQASTSKTAFVHVTTAANTFGQESRLDYPNQSSSDIVMITRRDGPEAFSYLFTGVPFLVLWDPTLNIWKILQDKPSPGNMALDLLFNVLVIKTN